MRPTRGYIFEIIIMTMMKRPFHLRNSLSSRQRSSRAFFLTKFIVIVIAGCFVGFITLAYVAWNIPIASQNPNARTTHSSSSNPVQRVRQEFSRRYGTHSRNILNALHQYGSLQATAERLLRASAQRRPFQLGFAGYSVTVGRGNYFQQSFPFIVQQVLQPLFLESPLKLQISVRNGAIGGIPSFPYAFCFSHFLGAPLDVVSWDFSMNEGPGASILESYIRQSSQQLQSPMLILLDTNVARCQLLKDYAQRGWLQDAICIGNAKDMIDSKTLVLPDAQKPPGLQHWDEFGAPPQCPGRGSWHPKKMEHELIGWTMAMYFVSALELAQDIAAKNPQWQSQYAKLSASIPTFGPPLTSIPDNDGAVNELLYGHKQSNNEYMVKQISCRTNFLPAEDHDTVLPSIVVSGLASVTAESILEARTDAQYESGWVLDISALERDTKIKVERCGGLGYVDMKIALYGIPESGTLRLWLPMEGPPHDEHVHDDDTTAKHWFDDMVICEANEKRGNNACRLDQDVEYVVGGVVVQSTKMVVGAAEYLKRKTCVHVGVPDLARVTTLGDVQNVDGTPIDTETLSRLSRESQLKSDHVGLVVDIRAKSAITRANGACCISHVVWEQH